MANLQANLRSQFAVALEDPCHFMPLVNRLFYESTADHHYATLFFAIYEDNLKRLRYANCGHMPALLLRNDGNIERLDATGTVVGLFEEWDCGIEERTLASGDTLLLYTDGVTEASAAEVHAHPDCSVFVHEHVDVMIAAPDGAELLARLLAEVVSRMLRHRAP